MAELSPYLSQRSSPSPLPLEGPTDFGSFVEAEEKVHLWDYWRVVSKHRWLIVTVFLAGVFTTAFRTFTETPLYTAETTLLIERQAPQVLRIQEALPESPYWDEYDYYKTQYEVLRSRTLAAQVIREQGLEHDPSFTGQGMPVGLVAKLWTVAKTRIGIQQEQNASPSFPLQETSREMSPPEIDPALVNTYTGMLDIRPIRYTRLVKVAFRSPDPSLSVRLANAHVAAYIRQGLQLRTQASGEAEKFLEEKLVGLKERLEKSEVALNRYRRDKGIISLDDKENIVVERLTDLNKRLTEAEAERIALEAQVQLIHSREYDSLPAVLNSTLIQTLKEHVGRLDGEYAQLSAQFKPGYPRLIQLQAQVEETRRRLKQEIQNVTAGLESAYLAAVTREEELRTSMEKQKAETLGLKDAAVEYAILAREVDTNRQLYDNVLQRTKEMGMVAELRTSNVSIIDKAERPLGPSSPNKRRSLLFGALLGLLGGVGLAFFFEYLDNTLKTPEEVERYLRIPNLSVVPDFFRLSRRLPHSVPKASRHTLESNGEIKEEMRQYPSPQIGVPSKQLVVSHQPASLVAEAYRILRAAMLLSRPGEPPRTILFTSATQGEGKTTTVGNTAIIFAQMGVKVLVVDTDLRRSHFHSVFGVKNQPGLAELLTGQKELHEVTQPTAIENLFAISSGATPPNPAELVGSRKMYEILAALRAQYDFIFLDSPPVMPVSDAVFLSSMVDGVIIVVGGQETPKRLVKQACLRLGAAQAKIFGVVLNRVNLYSGDYSDYYYHYYSYYHYQGSEQAVHQN